MVGAGATGVDEPVSWRGVTGDCPPPVGTLSTYSFGAEVGSGLGGAGVVSVGVVVVWVGVVVCAGVCVVWVGVSVD